MQRVCSMVASTPQNLLASAIPPSRSKWWVSSTRRPNRMGTFVVTAPRHRSGRRGTPGMVKVSTLVTVATGATAMMEATVMMGATAMVGATPREAATAMMGGTAMTREVVAQGMPIENGLPFE
mmetsp:Transcript_121645/g.242349  ORF Transcript_121645/g.242349 Transcript_121645/m.242349 type:complete len:123 (+) Transcript_121645:1126-1494(+)